MRPVPAFLFLSVLSVVMAQETTTVDDKLNSIESKPSVRLDPYIRKALLKALSELEEGETVTHAESTDGTSTFDSDIFNTDEDATTHNENESIKIHSFVVNGQSAFDNSTNTLPAFLDRNISILSTTVGNVENQVTASLPTLAPFREIFQAKESGVNFQKVRNVQSLSKSNNLNTINKDPSKPTTTTTTTTTSTTTTTPKPTHNEDGENIEEVNKQDVQVFQAPLVAAFTVHQDAHGSPKKVIPIYQQTTIQESLKPSSATNFASEVLPPQNFPVEEHKSLPTEYISQQLLLQKQLEEKQRILEEQLRLLQFQQRQQEELLRKQQFLLQQKEIQRQQQLLFEQEQFKKQQAGINQLSLQSNQVTNNLQLQASQKNVQQVPSIHQNIGFRPQTPQISIQPSVSLEATSAVGGQQQLPNREAVDFLIHLRSQQSQQFPLQDNHLPQGISNFLQPNTLPNFHQGPDFNQLRLTDDQLRQKQSTRVFRQESGVGNFGINNPNFPRFNSFGPVYTNRFVPHNRQNNFSSDNELKQLLAQNGLNGRAHEDLNIVTKVLSLNHGIPFNNVSNRLPFDSRRHVRTPV